MNAINKENNFFDLILSGKYERLKKYVEKNEENNLFK